MKRFLIGTLAAGGLFAQDNAAVPAGRTAPLALENTLKGIKPFNYWLPLPQPQATAGAGVPSTCAVAPLEIPVAKDKTFTMLQMAPNNLMDTKMVANPALGACVVEPSPKLPAHPAQ